MAFDLASNIPATVGAIGALGIAAAGLVDAFKIFPNGGVSNSGYRFIEHAVQRFYDGQTRRSAKSDVKSLLDVLHGNWINGVALTDQKAIAKSLIKVRLNATTAADFAKATEVDKDALQLVAQKLSMGTQLDPADTNVLGRFDLALTAILEDCYQHADQRYRNAAKMAAMIVSAILAVFGGWAISDTSYWWSSTMWQCFMCGLLATPLAPVAKDLTSALTAGVKVAQSIRGVK